MEPLFSVSRGKTGEGDTDKSYSRYHSLTFRANFRGKMRVAELLDNHFLPNGNWQGLSLGKTTVVWLAFILSEGDHRLYRVEPWGQEHLRTLRRCLDSKVRPRDLADD